MPHRVRSRTPFWRAARLCIAAVCVVAAFDSPLPGSAAAPAGGPGRPSILLLTIDTIRSDGLPFAGYARNTAPFLSAMAGRSVVFTNAYSTSSWTVPAVTSLVTGLYPRSHGVVHGVLRREAVYDQEVIPDSLPVMAEELKKLGYRTYAVTANAHLGPAQGYGRGFDRYLCVGLQPAEAVGAALLKWKEEIAGSPGPVFIWVHYYDPHHPYVQNEPWFGQFLPGVTAADARLLLQAKGSPPVLPRDPAQRERMTRLARALYDSEIRHVDEEIAALYRAFPALGRCLTIVTGDHGEEFLDHGHLTHCHNLYNETLKVPFFVTRPGATAADAAEFDAPVSLVDVAPTIVRLAGGTPPARWSGVALFPGEARTPAVPADRRVMAELERDPTSGHQQCLVTPQWKYIRNVGTGASELYDLKNDPEEKRDLRKTQIGRAAALGHELDAFLSALPPCPTTINRKIVSKQTEVDLKGQGYIH